MISAAMRMLMIRRKDDAALRLMYSLSRPHYSTTLSAYRATIAATRRRHASHSLTGDEERPAEGADVEFSFEVREHASMRRRHYENADGRLYLRYMLDGRALI